MKKLLALFLAVLMMFSLVACGGEKTNNDNSNPSSNGITTGEDDVSEDYDNQELVLDGNDEYVVCVKKDSTLTIASIKDIKGIKVGAVYGSDGQKIAEHYGADFVGYGGENDAFSDLMGSSNIDIVISRKTPGEAYANEGKVKIALNPIVIE